MSSTSFEFVVEDGRPTVRGDLDSTNADLLYRWLREGHGGEGAIDLSGVRSFDSSALRSVLRAVEDDPRIRVVNPSAVVTKVLRATRMYDHVVDELT